jgi:hypothetical protein
VSATWSRAAGASTGTCTVQLTGKTFGQLLPFTFTFELLSYTGAMSYVVTTNAITGFLSLTNDNVSSNVLAGPVSFVRVATNRLDQLTLLPNVLTNRAGQALGYPAEDIQRDTGLKTNYFGYLDFDDGDPSTSTPDYVTWVLSIDDRNDTNGNGIPDLSDDPGAPIATGPTLGLSRSNNQLILSVQASLGSSFQVEQIQAITGTNWVKALTLSVTNSPQLIALPTPITPTAFWRLRTQ